MNNQEVSHIEKWKRIFTKEPNRDKVAIAIAHLYKRMGKKNPVIIYESSPFAALIKSHNTQLTEKIENNLQLYSKHASLSKYQPESDFQMGPQIECGCYNYDMNIMENTIESIRHKSGMTLANFINRNIEGDFSSTISKISSQLFSVGRVLLSQIRSRRQITKIRNNAIGPFYCIKECMRYSYAYDSEKIKEKENNIYNTFITLRSEINYMILFENVCIVSENPVKICWEDDSLHNSTGKSVEYADGWGIYTWHGVPVSEKTILYPEEITREDIMKETNLDVRRCMQEKLGGRYAQVLGIDIIDRDGDYILYKTKKRDGLIRDFLKFIEVTCPSTGRKYLLGVPPGIRSCKAAVAWTFEKTAEDYKPLIET